MIRAILAVVLLLAGCAPAARPAAPAHVANDQRWTAVLAAGDGSIPVFDTATARVAHLLAAVGTAPADIHRLSAAPDILAQPHVQLSAKPRLLDAIASLRPQPGQACLVFITSHGGRGEGVYLAPHDEFLTPAELDSALQAGCGQAPTVAIVSACYSGDFAKAPMVRDNRIIMTAAAADRSSFGCGAGQELAFYDECVLRSLQSLPRTWPEVIADTGRCVTTLETAQHDPPSAPQSAVGPGVRGLAPLG